jgi:hypothetical protein
VPSGLDSRRTTAVWLRLLPVWAIVYGLAILAIFAGIILMPTGVTRAVYVRVLLSVLAIAFSFGTAVYVYFALQSEGSPGKWASRTPSGKVRLALFLGSRCVATALLWYVVLSVRI